MTIASSEIKFMKSQAVGDASSNGGRMSDTEAANGVKNNIWPDVPASERTAGSTKYRKVFIKIANADNLKLVNSRVFVETPTPGGDRVIIFPATQTDVQSDVSGTTPTLYGAGQLNANVSIGASTLTVNVEDASDAIFNQNQLIRISNMADVGAATGTEEFVRIKNDGTGVVWNGTLATLTLATGTTLANAYSSSNTRVASVIEVGDIWAKTDTWALSSSGGTLGGWNGSGNAPSLLTDARMVDNIAGIEQTWTITFTNSTTFTCVGDTVGSVGGGSKVGDFAPNNPAYSRPYFTLSASLWSGTWATGNVVTFKTHPAAIPIWEKRIIPPATSDLSGDKVIIAIAGESE